MSNKEEVRLFNQAGKINLHKGNMKLISAASISVSDPGDINDISHEIGMQFYNAKKMSEQEFRDYWKRMLNNTVVLAKGKNSAKVPGTRTLIPIFRSWAQNTVNWEEVELNDFLWVHGPQRVVSAFSGVGVIEGAVADDLRITFENNKRLLKINNKPKLKTKKRYQPIPLLTDNIEAEIPKHDRYVMVSTLYSLSYYLIGRI